MKKILLILIVPVVLFTFNSEAATYYTRSSGVWTTNIWGTTSTGTGGGLPTLNDGDILYIDDNISINADVTIGADVTIIVAATLTIRGKLSVGGGSVFQFPSSAGRIVPDGPGNSEKIFIGGGPSEWTGNDGTLTGPGSFDDGWTCCTLSLPVTLLDFQATDDGNSVFLSWTTVMEENFKEFIVQRSVDGLVYQDIGTLEGRGFDLYDTRTHYTFQDANPRRGYNYYRLRAVDLDENYEYFGVKVVQIVAPRSLDAYPNPSSGEVVSFNTNFSPGEFDRIILNDRIGNEVFNAPALGLENKSISFPERLEPGLYMLRYVSRDFEQVIRISVMR